MCTLQNIEFYRVSPTEIGIFAHAKYRDWVRDYNFLIQPDGRVKGKTAAGWQELTEEATRIIRAKIQRILIHDNLLIA